MSSDFKVEDEFDLDEPSEEILQWAKVNIKEDVDTRCDAISSLRDMIYANDECTPHRMDDEFLLRFLRARNFDVEKSYVLLTRYCEFRKSNPDFVCHVDLNHLKELGNTGLISVPPLRESSGRRLLIYRVEQWNPETVSINDWFQATLFVLELAVLEPRAQILGGIGIFDFDGLTMNQAMYMTPSVAYKVLQIMVTCFPMKIHALHIVNQSSAFNAMYTIFKPFLNSKMKQRIFFHGDNWSSLHKHVDPKYLPIRYGGVNPDYNYKNWVEKLRKIPRVMEQIQLQGYEDNIKD